MDTGYELMSWDTNFFGFPVMRLEKNFLNDRNNLERLTDLDNKEIGLIYYTSTERILPNDHDLYEIQYVMKRIPIIKRDLKRTPQHPNVSLYTENFPDRELIELGQLAGRQGRFGRDKYISVDQCDAIFEQWIINSVKKKMASHVIVYREEGKIVGFCSLKIDGGTGYAPLLAVERKWEGRGISFALMREAENIFIENNCDRAVSGTQDLNIKALKVYERFGLKPQEPEFTYHIWNKKLLKSQNINK